MTATRSIRLGDRDWVIEDFSGRKATRAFRLLQHIATGAPEILREWARFSRAYEAENTLELTRAEALAAFPPVHGPIAKDGDASEPIVDETGAPRMFKLRPGRYEHLSDEDWAASGNKVRLPRSPGLGEQIAAVFPTALELAEEQVLRLLAIVVTPNRDVKERRGEALWELLDEVADDLLDAPFEDLIELAVVAGETVDEQYKRKASELGDRLGNALRLFGLDPKTLLRDEQPTTEPEAIEEQEVETSTSSSETSKPTSSTSSPEPTDGDPTPPSTPTSASSPASALA